MIDREIYFANVRDELFEGALEQIQVDGQNVILAVWEYEGGGTPMEDQRWLAYMLATVFKECAMRMWPITEYGSDEYLQGKSYWPYIGRGFVQLTHDYNYDKASKALGLIDERDLVEHPDMALDSLIAARIMFRGMAEGWFTGKKLGQYFNDEDDDPINARQIINGNDCDKEIAGYYDKFLDAIAAASTFPGCMNMTDEPMPPRKDETMELRRKTLEKLDGMERLLRGQEDRLDRMGVVLDGMERDSDFESLIYAWTGGGFIGLLIGFGIGWAL